MDNLSKPLEAQSPEDKPGRKNTVSANTETATLNDSQREAARTGLRALQRAVKAVCLYPATNPLVTQARLRYHEDFLRAIEVAGILRLQIGKDAFFIDERELPTDRHDDPPLAKLLFENGLAQVAFMRSFDTDSADTFLETLRQIVQRETNNIDLSVILWAAEIRGFVFTAIEDIALEDYSVTINQLRKSSETQLAATGEATSALGERHPVFESGDAVSDEGRHSIAELEVNFGADDPAASAGLHTHAPTPTEMIARVYALDEDEKRAAENALREDDNFCETVELAALLTEMLQQEGDLADFMETCVVADRVQAELLKRGEFLTARNILQTMRTRQEELVKARPMWAQKLAETLVSAASRDRLRSLAIPLNAQPDREPTDFVAYLSLFDWTTYTAVADLLGELVSRRHRLALCEHLAHIGKEHVDLIANGIYDKRWYVARNTAIILSRISSSRSHKHLEKAFANPDARVRVEVVANLDVSSKEFAKNILRRSLIDSDVAIRETGLRQTMLLASAESSDIFESVIGDGTFVNLPETIRREIYIAFAGAAANKAARVLAVIAAEGSFFGSGNNNQSMAFAALAHCPSEEAHTALKKMSGSWKNSVKELASKSLTEWERRYGEMFPNTKVAKK